LEVASLVGPNCLIESDFPDDGHGNLEAVLFATGQLHHVFRHGGNWQAAQTIASPASGPGSMIQSDFGNGVHGNFEVVLWNGTELVHWWHDNSDVNLPWQRGQTISVAATGPGCIIQSDFGGEHKNFEVVVLEGNQLVHYWHNNSDVNLPWQRGQTISVAATGPGCIIQSDFGGEHKNFEVVVLEGNQLVHYWHDNSDVNLPWQRGQTISVAATGPGCIAKSTFGPGGPGNFEVLAAELTRSVVHYWHHNSDVTLPWWRTGALRASFAEIAVYSPDVHQTVKIAQLTGEFDREINAPTLSQTQSRFGVVGCDLGQSFEHLGRAYFCFGDTITDGHIRQDPSPALDTIGFTSDTDPSNGIRLDLNPTYPYVEGIDQGVFCVPADGVSIGPASTPSVYMVFTTCHRGDPPFGDTMGRSVLARSDNGALSFGSPLYELSRDRFINVSLQLVENRDFPGLPDSRGQGLLVWGSGGYRRSNVYLAYVPTTQIEDRSAFSFYAGQADGQPVWSGDEAQAVALILSGSIGELCVRRDPFLNRFILLYNSDNPAWILEQQSPAPWGPWTAPQNIFDAAAAYGHYIHTAGSADGLSDPGREAEGGGPYGPYIVERYTRPNPDGSITIFFVLSVWNPYNTMLMSATIRPHD
jgi:hypothetical protein